MVRILKVRNGRVPDGAVYVGRIAALGDPFWGNAYSVRRVGSREEALLYHEADLKGNDTKLARIDELRGRDLCCHCAPKGCHAEVLAEVAHMSHEARMRWRVSELSCLEHDFEEE